MALGLNAVSMMNTYSTPEEAVKMMEMQHSKHFTIFHTNKRESAFRGGDDNLSEEEAREAFLQACRILANAKYWVEIKPKKLADKGTVSKFWLQIGDSQNQQIGTQQTVQNGVPSEVLALMDRNHALQLDAMQKSFEHQEALRKAQEEQDNKPDLIGALLSEPSIKESISAVLQGIAGMIVGSGNKGNISGVQQRQSMEGSNNQQTQEQQANAEANQRVLIAASEIHTALVPMGFHVVDIMEKLAVLAKENPSKLKMAIGFL